MKYCKLAIVYFVLASAMIACGSAIHLFYTKTALFNALTHAGENNLLSKFFLGFSYMGDGVFAIIISLIILLTPKYKRLGLAVMLAYIFTFIISQVAKNIFQMQRPPVHVPNSLLRNIGEKITTSFNSFPSGHTAAAFAFATIIALHFKNKLVQIFIFLWALLVGYSRVYLGNHYLEDVIAGAAIGIACAIFVAIWTDKIKLKEKKFIETKKS